MKKNLFFSIVSALSMLILFQSCDNTEFDTPAYEAESAKYIVTSENAEIKSLELSASGNYIVVKNDSYYGNYSIGTREFIVNNFMISKPTTTRAAEYENIIYGKFTKIGEDRYELEGYGTVVITRTGDEAVDLEIILKNGKTLNVGAQKEKKLTDSAATNNLCRTWKIAKVGISIKIGFLKFNKMMEHEKINELLKDYVRWAAKAGDEDMNEEEINEAIDEMINEYNEVKPISMIFTKSGSYMVEYQNGEIGISTWKWENEEEGIFRYSWNTNDIYSQNLGGTCSVSYKKNMLVITEIMGAEDEDDYYEEEGEYDDIIKISLMYGLEEVK